MWAASAWFRVEGELIDMTDEPSMSEEKVYAYILQIIDQKTLFTLLAPLRLKTAREVSKHLYRCFAEHGVPQVLHTDNSGEFTGIVLVTRCIRSVQVTSSETRYKTATLAGVLNRMHSGADLAKRTDCDACAWLKARRAVCCKLCLAQRLAWLDRPHC
jgi:hypothetical protein